MRIDAIKHGPSRPPGMREMRAVTAALIGQVLGDRFSGATHRFMVGHVPSEVHLSEGAQATEAHQ